MQVSICATILLSMSLEATSLLGVMASISSMNKIHGAELCKHGSDRKRSTWDQTSLFNIWSKASLRS